MTNSNENQLLHPEDAIAALLIRDMLKNSEEIGEPQWGELGRWEEPAKQLWEQRHSIDEVRKKWGNISNILPELKVLVSGDLPNATASDYWLDQLRTPKDAYAPRPPTHYVVEGIFQAASLNVVYGAPGVLKSMITVDAAACAVAGEPFLQGKEDSGFPGYKTQKSAALLLDFDNGRRRTDERIEALARVRRLAEDDPLYYLSLPSPWLDAGSKDLIDELAILISKLDAKLVVIDNLGLVSGDAQENSTEMGHVMGNLRRLAEETDAAIIVIHHQRKSGGMNARAGDSLRGHSSIEASLDLALRVDRPDGGENVVMTATKVRGVDVPTIGAVFTYLHKPGTTELSEARFFGEVVETPVMKRKRMIQEAILTCLRDMEESPNQKKLWEEVKANLETSGMKIGRDKIVSEINSLSAKGKIITQEGKHGSLMYKLVKI